MRIGSGVTSVWTLFQKLALLLAGPTQSCRWLFISALGSLLFAHTSPAFAQTPCGSGVICQGSGCSQEENNPNDKLNFANVASGSTITFSVTRLPNNPADASSCALSFDVNGVGQFTAGLKPPLPTTNGETANLTGGQSVPPPGVVYTNTGVAGSVAIKIGPPTSSGQQNCDNPAVRKAFSYTATCSFAPPPTLKLVKKVVPNTDPGRFDLFIKDKDGNTTSAINVGDGEEAGPVNVVPKETYQISETGNGTNLSNYTTTVACTDGINPTGGSVTDQNGAKVKIPDNFTGNAVCTITNTRKTVSKIKIIKDLEPNGDPGKFDLSLKFNNVVIATATNVGDNGTLGFVDVFDLGTYNVSETGNNTNLALYDTTITCVKNNVAGAPTIGTSADVTIGQNDKEVVCTIKNTRKPVVRDAKVTLKKVTTDGSTGTFQFTSTVPNLTGPITTNGGSGALGPGNGVVDVQQSITEADPSPNYQLVGAQCKLTGGGDLAKPVVVDLGNRTVSFTPSADEEIICTFTNFKKSDDPMEEETERFIHRRVDNLLTYGPDRARMLRRLQEQPQQQQSLKDEPLKLGAVSSTSLGGASAAGGGSFGQMDAMSALPSSTNRMAAVGSTLGSNPFAKATLPGDETDDEQVVAYGQQAAPSMFSQVAGQFTPLVNGQGSYSFSTSLSELRAAAVTAEEQSSRKKLQDAGLSLASQPYTNPYLTSRQGLDVWVEGHVAKYDDDVGGINREGDFRLLYIGADYLLRPGFLIGALVQIDDTNEDIDDPVRSGNIDGTGWLAGPYVGIKVLENLYFDARAAWGQSDNDIELTDAAGARSGSFDTDRWLATASLTGNERFGAWRLSPQIAIAYGSESSDAYTNSLGQSVGSTDAKIGRLTGTAEVGYRFQRADGTMIEPHVALTGIWNFDSDDLIVNGVVVDTEESRAKVDGGVLITLPSGLGVRGAASYDGIGADDYHAVSGSLWLNVPLN